MEAPIERQRALAGLASSLDPTTVVDADWTINLVRIRGRREAAMNPDVFITIVFAGIAVLAALIAVVFVVPQIRREGVRASGGASRQSRGAVERSTQPVDAANDRVKPHH